MAKTGKGNKDSRRKPSTRRRKLFKRRQARNVSEQISGSLQPRGSFSTSQWIVTAMEIGTLGPTRRAFPQIDTCPIETARRAIGSPGSATDTDVDFLLSPAATAGMGDYTEIGLAKVSKEESSRFAEAKKLREQTPFHLEGCQNRWANASAMSTPWGVTPNITIGTIARGSSRAQMNQANLECVVESPPPEGASVQTGLCLPPEHEGTTRRRSFLERLDEVTDEHPLEENKEDPKPVSSQVLSKQVEVLNNDADWLPDLSDSEYEKDPTEAPDKDIKVRNDPAENMSTSESESVSTTSYKGDSQSDGSSDSGSVDDSKASNSQLKDEWEYAADDERQAIPRELSEPDTSRGTNRRQWLRTSTFAAAILASTDTPPDTNQDGTEGGVRRSKRLIEGISNGKRKADESYLEGSSSTAARKSQRWLSEDRRPLKTSRSLKKWRATDTLNMADQVDEEVTNDGDEEND